jgi:hypothetical protein
MTFHEKQRLTIEHSWHNNGHESTRVKGYFRHGAVAKMYSPPPQKEFHSYHHHLGLYNKRDTTK